MNDKIVARQEFLGLAADFLLYKKGKNEFSDDEVMKLSIFSHGVAVVFDEVQEERMKRRKL